jgi:hypothetical protein
VSQVGDETLQGAGVQILALNLVVEATAVFHHQLLELLFMEPVVPLFLSGGTPVGICHLLLQVEDACAEG